MKLQGNTKQRGSHTSASAAKRNLKKANLLIGEDILFYYSRCVNSHQPALVVFSH